MGLDNNKRLLYIDALRGITMILVVYHHIVNQCFPETIIDKGLQSFRMPMFFFISGFIAYKELGFWTAGNTIARLFKKFRVQVITTVIFFSLYCFLVQQENPLEVFTDQGWMQYWFTIVLFEFFAIYFTTNYLTRKSPKANVAAILSIAVASIILFHTTSKTDQWCVWTQFYGFTSYMYFFLFGTLARRYFDNVKRWLDKWWVLAMSIMLFVAMHALFYLSFKDIVLLPQPLINFMSAYPMRITGLIMVFGLFVKFRDSFSRDKVMTRTLSFIGGRTLDIYFLHFFFITNIKDLHAVIVASGWGQWERPLTIVLAGLVVAACLLVSGLIRKCKPAGKLLFGAKY